MSVTRGGFLRNRIGRPREGPAQHGRVDRPRQQAVGTDAVLRIVERDVACQRDDRPFGRDIGGVASPTCQRELRAEGHDRPASSTHSGENRLDPRHGSHQVHLQNLCPCLARGFVKLPADGHCGACHQNVHRPKVGNRCFGCRDVGDVGLQDTHAYGRCAGRNIRGKHLGALRGKQRHRCRPQTRGRAGDDAAAARQNAGHRHAFFC